MCRPACNPPCSPPLVRLGLGGSRTGKQLKLRLDNAQEKHWECMCRTFGTSAEQPFTGARAYSSVHLLRLLCPGLKPSTKLGESSSIVLDAAGVRLLPKLWPKADCPEVLLP